MCVVCCWQWWVEWRLCTVPLEWCTMGRKKYPGISFMDTLPHMRKINRKINRNSTSLQVHVVCVHTLNIIYKNFF
jgi:hypothetical protein